MTESSAQDVLNDMNDRVANVDVSLQLNAFGGHPRPGSLAQPGPEERGEALPPSKPSDDGPKGAARPPCPRPAW